MFTKYDKAAAAGGGVAVVTVIAWIWPMPTEVQGALTLIITTGLTWLVPNKVWK